MKLHIFRLSGHDFVHYRKIEIGANDRAVYQQSISCFIVYANFDWFLINCERKKSSIRVYVNGEKLFTIDGGVDKSEFMDDIERRKIPVKSYYVNQLKKNRK